MTLQKIYNKTANVFPSLSIIGDDTNFQYILEIPPDQLELSISLGNVLYAKPTPIPNTICQTPTTTSLSGNLALDSTSVSVTTSTTNTIVHYAGYNTNTIIFTYQNIPKILTVGDTINSATITKVVNRIGNLCYAEVSNSLPFTKDTLYTSNTNTTIQVVAGYGIIDRCAVIGTFKTDLKEIYYFAKFNVPTQPTVSTTEFSTFPVSPPVTTPNDSRWDSIQSSILNPSQTNQSHIQSIPAVTFTSNNSIIDGTSDLASPIKVTSFLDIPPKTSTVSYGIANYQPLDNRRDILGPIELPITISFIRNYVGVPNNTTPAFNQSVIDGWLLHEWSSGYLPVTTEGSISCDLQDDTEPDIVYILNSSGVTKVSAFSGSGSNHQELILFAANDTLLYETTHVLDYNTEPFGSSDVTEHRGIQSNFIIPCVYNFSVDKLTLTNSVGGNILIQNSPETRLTSPFFAVDTTIRVEDTSAFLDSGFLSIPVYTIDATVINKQESRKYNYFGNMKVYYSHKTQTEFLGVERIDFLYTSVLKSNSIELTNNYPTISQWEQ